ncbi:MAG TPA: cupredoxin domain-containing protein [Chloroflexota bacterium]
MRLSLFALGVLALPLLAACSGGGSGGGGLPVTASDYKFEPANLTVKAGQAAQVTVRNTAGQVHDWTVQGLDKPVAVTVSPGQTQNISFTPSKAGTYKIVCVQPGHEQLGMVGQLVVQ